MEKRTEQEEFEAFEGLNQSYIEMEKRIEQSAPLCHFRKMYLDEIE